MEINEKTVDAWIAYWKNYIGNYDLPAWESIPDFGLYMEQVVTFIKDCLKYIDGGEDDAVITASAINNYVRKKYMPQPVKKRYYRKHLAYLIILCALKQALSMSDIQAVIPMDASEEQLREFYESFVQQHKRAADYFIDLVDQAKNTILKDCALNSLFRDNATELIVDSALIASFAKLISERIIRSGDILSDKINAEPTLE